MEQDIRVDIKENFIKYIVANSKIRYNKGKDFCDKVEMRHIDG